MQRATSSSANVFSDHTASILVLAQSNKLRMSQMTDLRLILHSQEARADSTIGSKDMNLANEQLGLAG